MAKKKDLTGLIVGNLTVIEEIPQRRSDGKVMWKCQCSCGNITNVVGTLLTHKTRPTQSCGCLQRKRTSEANRQKGMEGQRYGYLTVLEWYNGEWKCQCDCGNIIYVSTNNLHRGNTKSCGCIKNSYGESKIAQLLEENNIFYQKEYTFPTCRNPETGKYLRFDFYVNNEYLIEYDGEQHYRTTSWGDYKVTQQRDNYKTKWCEENHIPLIRIPYTKLDSLTINDLLLN